MSTERGSICITTGILGESPELLFLFVVNRVLSQSGAILFDLKFFATRLFTNGIVVVTRFFTNEVQYFEFLFAFTLFGHGHSKPTEGLFRIFSSIGL